MKNLPRITYGNDFNIKIYMTELVNEEPVPYDLTDCTDVQVQMFCSKHKTMFELPYTIDPNEPSVINAQIDYRLTHPNTMYGFVVSGYDDLEQHFQWCQRPSEGIMVVENSSGAYLDASIDNTIDIAARIGFNLNMSNYYDKGQIDAMFENYYTITDIDTYLAQKQDILVSGTNIKTINNQSILGEGDIEIEIPEQEQADWNESDNTQPDFIKNKPDLSIYAESSDLATVATTGDYDDLSNTPDLSIYAESSDLATVATTGDYTDLSNTPDLSIYAESSDLATVATTGDYDDLSNKPDLSIYAESSDLATVATSGSYTDLSNTPDLSIYAESSDLAQKQDVLVSGTNIKTINNQSILGEGNITIEAGETQVQSDWEQTDDTQVDYIKNKPDFVEPKIEFVEEAPEEKDPDVIYVESPVYDIKTTSIDIVNEAPEEVEEGKIVIVSNPIQLKTINNQEIVGEGNIEIQGGGTQIQSDWSQSDNTQVDYIKNKPDLSVYAESSDLSTVATSGSYTDLSNTPNLATVATTGDYTDLSNTPDLSNYVTKTNEIDKYRIVIPWQYSTIDNKEYVYYTFQVFNNVTNELVWQPAKYSTLNEAIYSLETRYNLTVEIISNILLEPIVINVVSSDDLYRFRYENIYTRGVKFVVHKVINNNYIHTKDGGMIQSNYIIPYNKYSDVAYTNDYTDLSNTPNLATVATSGSYTDLSNTPDLSIYAESSDLATVATTGDYTDLSNTPDLTTKQDTLVSGTNIKTINNQSLLGSGNITIQAGGTQIQSDWSQSDNTQVDYIKNKPDLSVYVQSSNLAAVATTGSYNSLNDKPTIPPAQIQSDWSQSDNTQKDFIKNKPNLATVATSGNYNDLTNKPTIPPAQIQSDWSQSDNTQVDYIKNKPTIPAAQIQSDWSQSDNTQVDYIKNKPNLATVATTGDYDDLTNKPTIPPAQIQSDWTETNTSSKAYIQNKPNLATVATSGSYNDLSNTPTIPTVPTNVSEFNNDAGYLTSIPNTVVTSDTTGLMIKVVNALPPSPANNTIYIIQ